MHFDVSAGIRNLHCTTPTDPSGVDEPYMWLFFIRLDGTTIRQRVGAPTGLSASITVTAAPGRQGNLGVESVSSGANIHVPPALGQFSTPLKPITLDLFGATQVIRVFAPGSVLVVALLIDKDSAPAEASVAAFEAVKEHIEFRFNDLVNGINLTPIILAALAASDPAAGAQAALFNLLSGFQQTIIQEATDLAIERAKEAALAASDWWNPVDLIGLGVAALDPDEFIGSATWLLTERSLIAGSLAQSLDGSLRQSSSGFGGAWYIASGGATADVKFASGDVRKSMPAPPERVLLREATSTIRTGRRCLEAGTQIRTTRVELTERHVVQVEYPFLRYRYFVDDVELAGDAGGTVTLNNKSVAYPEFDENVFYLIGKREEQRSVKLSFERTVDPLAPQLERLVITNDPRDGCYEVTLRIVAELPDGRLLPVDSDGLTITGQTLELGDGVFERYVACIAQYLKSLNLKVKPKLPDQWRTPEVKWQRLNVAVERMQAMKELQLIGEPAVERAKAMLAGKLGIG